MQQPIDETPPSLAEVRETVRKLNGGKGALVSNNSAEMLKVGVEAIYHGLHTVLSTVTQSGAISPDCKCYPYLEREMQSTLLQKLPWYYAAQCTGKVFAHLLLIRIRFPLQVSKTGRIFVTPCKPTIVSWHFASLWNANVVAPSLSTFA